MPLLLNVMQNANGPEYRKLRVKAMECAGLIGTSPLVLSWVDPANPSSQPLRSVGTSSAPIQEHSSSCSCGSKVCSTFVSVSASPTHTTYR